MTRHPPRQLCPFTPRASAEGPPSPFNSTCRFFVVGLLAAPLLDRMPFPAVAEALRFVLFGAFDSYRRNLQKTGGGVGVIMVYFERFQPEVNQRAAEPMSTAHL